MIAAIRRVAREVPAAGELVTELCWARDDTDPGTPAIAWDDPQARGALLDALSNVGLDAAGGEATGLLALVAGQDVEPGEGSDGGDGRWRIARRLATDRMVSVHDPDTRHVHKTVHQRTDAYKAHVAVEPDTGLVTECALRQAGGADLRRLGTSPPPDVPHWPHLPRQHPAHHGDASRKAIARAISLSAQQHQHPGAHSLHP